MPLSKTQSLPSIFMMGTEMPKGNGTNYGRKPAFDFRLNHGPVDRFKYTMPKTHHSEAAEKLRLPGWRQRSQAELPRPQTPTAVEDLIPKNTRHPRIAPAWLKHDKQVLRFYGFFQEHVTERSEENSRYRNVSFMYHMEDGTMQIAEPKVENSGIPQGQFLKRHRVPRADGNGFVGPDDFRCGAEIDIYGRVYKVLGCDRFTRWFYEENGIDVGEDEPMVEDLWQQKYKLKCMEERGELPLSKQAMDSKLYANAQAGQPSADQKVTQFLLNDRKVLRFKGYWDDPTLYGARIYMVLHYYLADNTVEINESHVRNSGRDGWPVFYKRGPLYKNNSVQAYPGMLVSDGGLYLPEDLRVGDTINVWGRQVVLYDCDDFTQSFYEEWSGHDQRAARIDVSDKPIKHLKLSPPPHNGIGTEEDSLINCKMISPIPAKPDVAKLMVMSGENLRFEAKMINGEPEDECRRFVVAFFPDTDRIGVYEIQVRNSGHIGGKFREKARIKNPDTGKYFELKDLYVGKTVNICSQPFYVIKADEHCLQFLEARPDEFPWADPAACADRIAMLKDEEEMKDHEGVSPGRLKELAEQHGVELLDHEVITLLRAFGLDSANG
eukprot:CAMPEP_0206428590 /NCGR_PEP_ID=MMETSP0324_2-20121206/5760_1 /ASSEMBLY_ACC=CAM_ASM_000836 /TAXON_ID=2866 /ORGANISM="Crypthecodinium cohnii, Strain Seligo" /LENGTH=606 /DNA_ID=CAMNT_0053894157 /DNA_START=68 /DNA_END=1884 /DNA_ORIENTATION=+